VGREDIELRLHGLKAPAGTISLGDLAPLAAALQLLVTRSARDVHGHTGPGRVVAAIEQIARLRLGAVRDGSTTLLLSAGDDTLPVETETFDRFWQVVAGLGDGRRPAWVTLPVAEVALDLASALDVARSVDFHGSRAGRPRNAVHLDAGSIDRTVWRMDNEPSRVSGVTVTGVLDLVAITPLASRSTPATGGSRPPRSRWVFHCSRSMAATRTHQG
jgi:hypothetical protein